MGRLALVRGSIGVGASVRLIVLVERRRKRRQDLGRSEPQTQTTPGCRRQYGSIGIGTWVDRRRDLGQADSIGQTALRTVLGPRSVGTADANGTRKSEPAWVDQRRVLFGNSVG